MSTSRKKLLRIILYIYAALMIVLLLSSKTIYNLSVPKVTVVMPQSGKLINGDDAKTYERLIPNEAVFHDGFGSFIWVVRSKQGAFGMEYYSVKIKVLVADSDEYYTAISRGMEYFEPVVVSFDKDLTVNGRVNRLE